MGGVAVNHVSDRQMGGAAVMIRPAIADDQRFICATWFRQLTSRQRHASQRKRINQQIDRVLDDCTTQCLVACHADTNRILGWLVYSSPPGMRVLHMAYVRDDERGHGLCRRLVDAAWPGSTARIVLTCNNGPHARQFLERNRGAMAVSLDDFYR